MVGSWSLHCGYFDGELATYSSDSSQDRIGVLTGVRSRKRNHKPKDIQEEPQIEGHEDQPSSNTGAAG
jgi:hypothetical protein